MEDDINVYMEDDNSRSGSNMPVLIELSIRQFLNKYNTKMEQSKSPKGLAYSRLGKQLSGKLSVPEQQMKMNRNQTGNIFQQLLKQVDSGQNKYVRTLITKNQKMEKQSASASTAAIHNRKKSYAEIEPCRQKESQRMEVVREQRDTLCKPKFSKDNLILNQMTPKNNPSPMTRSDFIGRDNQHHSVNMWGHLRKDDKKDDKNFIQNLNSYLQNLNQTADHIPQGNNVPAQGFTQTLKYSSNGPIPTAPMPGRDKYELASKLQKSQLKVKEYKFKNMYLQKEIGKFNKREKKMKECLYEMLQELKNTTFELTKEKKERKRLEKVIDSFELKQKPERKNIGKTYKIGKIQQFQHKINLFTQNEGSDLDSSIRQMPKHHHNHQSRRIRHDREYSQVHRGILDSNKIDELFKSSGGFRSEEQNSYDY